MVHNYFFNISIFNCVCKWINYVKAQWENAIYQLALEDETKQFRINLLVPSTFTHCSLPLRFSSVPLSRIVSVSCQNSQDRICRWSRRRICLQMSFRSCRKKNSKYILHNMTVGTCMLLLSYALIEHSIYYHYGFSDIVNVNIFFTEIYLLSLSVVPISLRPWPVSPPQPPR